MKTPPTQRSLKLLRSRGYTCGITEHWNGWIKRRMDLFSFVDIVCLDPVGKQVIFVQTTSGPNMSARLAKIGTIPAATVAHQAGVKIMVHGWRRVGPRGKRKVWECRIVEWAPLCTHEFVHEPTDQPMGGAMD